MPPGSLPGRPTPETSVTGPEAEGSLLRPRVMRLVSSGPTGELLASSRQRFPFADSQAFWTPKLTRLPSAVLQGHVHALLRDLAGSPHSPERVLRGCQVPTSLAVCLPCFGKGGEESSCPRWGAQLSQRGWDCWAKCRLALVLSDAQSLGLPVE